MSKITVDGVSFEFHDSVFTAEQWEQVASWVLNGGGEDAAENARVALQAASEAAKSAANADEDANSAKSYAVGGTGTRDGEDTDNAKYYARQAHAIAGEGMVFSVNGQQADEVGNVAVTKENIGLDKVNNTADTEKPVSLAQQQALDAKPNPNLLHNWYFANPVNQRGFSSYSYDVPRYTIDRWKTTDGSIFLDLTQTGCISITSEHGTTYLRQYLDGVQAGTYTASALVKSVAGTPNTVGAYGALFIGDGNVVASVYIKEAGLYSFTFTNDAAIKTFNLQTNFGNTIEIIAVKLELGTQQTLAHQDADGNWVLNEIPDYAEQLAICQRYAVTDKASGYIRFGSVLAESESVAHWFFPTPTAMRAAPATTFLTGTIANIFLEAGGNYTPVTSLSNAVYHQSYLDITVISSGLVAGKMYSLRTKTDVAKILFSADL